MDFYVDTPRHPCGLVNNPEWDRSRARRADLYLAERARLYAKPKPSPLEVFLTCLRRFWS